MRDRNLRHIGRKAHRAVHDAIHSGNFEEIGRAVDDSIHEFAEYKKEVFDNLKTYGQRPCNHYDSQDVHWQNAEDERNDAGIPQAFRRRMPGRISGLVYMIIGISIGIPMLIGDISVFIVGISASMPFNNFAVSASILTALVVLMAGMAFHGAAMRRRARRFTSYRDAIGGASFCKVEGLAETVGETQERTKKDLKKMISCGACPHGHLDSKETCFIVDDKTYEEYLIAEKAYKTRAEAEKAEEQKQQENPQEAELAAAIKEGNEYLRQIRDVNDALPGEVISKKLQRLENVTARIFACVRHHPEKLPDIRRFIRYYMPTTLKLVKSYEEFESQPVHGENITKAEKEIEQALDTINSAFENLLDVLFADDVLDVSSDISTLETMLKQEGLTGSDFEKKPDDNKVS